MISLITGLLIGLVIGSVIGFQIGYSINWIRSKLSDIYNRDPEPSSEIVTPLPPGYADVNSQSAFISPKTPQQIEREEQDRVRNLQ